MSKRLYEQMSLEVFQAPATLVSSFHKWMDTKKVPFEKGTFFNALTSFFQDFNSFKVLCNSSSPPPMYIHYVFDFGEERSQRKCQEGDKHTHSKGDSTTRSLVKNDRRNALVLTIFTLKLQHSKNLSFQYENHTLS